MPLSEAVLSAIIGGSASLAGAGIGAAGAAMANRRAYNWSKRYYTWQNQFNLQHYSPAMQMEYLRQAGLNPHQVNGSPSQPVGNMTADYQNPVDGNALPNAVLTAFNMYQQNRALQNSTAQTASDVELKRANTAKAEADAARINYYNSMIQPWEAIGAKHKSEILNYNVGRAKLENQRLLNDISMFSLQKQKYQVALDLMEIEKKYADEYHRLRNKSVGADAKIKEAEAGYRGLDLHNYQTYGIRPQDPYYLRLGTNIIDNIADNTSIGARIRRWIFGN